MTALPFDPGSLREDQRILIARLSERFSPEPGNARLNECVERWAAGGHLSFDEARATFDELLSESSRPFQTGVFLTLGSPDFLASDEIAGFASALRDRAEPVSILTPAGEPEPLLLDTCGTGGDTIPTFNISTTLMFILAAEGVKVAKHGNRAFTSRSGSSDVLQKLGINIGLDSTGVRRCIEEVGAGFMFAPNFHKATKKVAEIRGVLGEPLPDGSKFKTMFNILGPLSNPARPPLQVLGVYSTSILQKEAAALARLGHIHRGFVVHGRGNENDPVMRGRGLDEASTLGPTEVFEVSSAPSRAFTLLPEEHFGLARASAADIVGGDADANAQIILGILDGSVTGARLDIAVANAALAFALLDNDLAHSLAVNTGVLKSCVARAREAIQSGRALEKLTALRHLSNQLA